LPRTKICDYLDKPCAILRLVRFQIRTIPFWLVLALFLALTVSAQTTDNYKPGPDSKPQPSVPKGEILKFTFAGSKIFPGTTRD